MKRLRVATLSFFIAIWAVVSAAPHGETKDVVLIEDIVSVGISQDKADDRDSNVALITLSQSSSSEEDSSSNSRQTLDLSDDLIFLTHRNQSKVPQAPQSFRMDTSAAEEANPLLSTAIVTPIDMTPFVALIPSQQVQTIAANYYRHDLEVQRACAFLNSEHFAEVKSKILMLPEVLAFTRYLNASGLDVLKLAESLVQASKPSSSLLYSSSSQDSDSIAGSEMVKSEEKNSTREPLDGLHGLVDSILDVLPQDQILATFFDKIETDQQFSKLIESIGTHRFSKILSTLQSSVPIRNLIFELHNNRIYITRIMESLKSYFFLASF